jgi:hypothetical protein
VLGLGDANKMEAIRPWAVSFPPPQAISIRDYPRKKQPGGLEQLTAPPVPQVITMLALLATYAMASVCLGLDGACTRAREMGGQGGHWNPLVVFLPDLP